MKNLSRFVKANFLDKNINSLRSTIIREYDMRSAGFSMIKAHKLLPPETIDRLKELENDKFALNVEIGKIRKYDSDFSKKLSDSIRKTITTFLTKNKVKEDEILSIKNDAIFIRGRRLIEYLEVNGGSFKLDNTFTSYYYINDKEFYFDSVNSKLVTKGFGGDIVSRQKDMLFHEFSFLFQQAEVLSYEELLFQVKEFKEEYLSKALEVGCYRELNPNNSFRIDVPNGFGRSFFISEMTEGGLTDEFLKRMNIEYNYIHYIIPLIQRLVI